MAKSPIRLKLGLRARELLHFPLCLMNRLNKTESTVTIINFVCSLYFQMICFQDYFCISGMHRLRVVCPFN